MLVEAFKVFLNDRLLILFWKCLNRTFQIFTSEKLGLIMLQLTEGFPGRIPGHSESDVYILGHLNTGLEQ